MTNPAERRKTSVASQKTFPFRFKCCQCSMAICGSFTTMLSNQWKKNQKQGCSDKWTWSFCRLMNSAKLSGFASKWLTQKQTSSICSGTGLDYRDVSVPQKSGYGWRIVESESTSHNVFPDLPPNLFSLPLLHLCKVLTISLNLLLSHFFFLFCFLFFTFIGSLLFLFFFQFVLWIDRILTTFWLKFWDDNEDFSMRISLWSVSCSSRNVTS